MERKHNSCKTKYGCILIKLYSGTQKHKLKLCPMCHVRFHFFLWPLKVLKDIPKTKGPDTQDGRPEFCQVLTWRTVSFVSTKQKHFSLGTQNESEIYHWSTHIQCKHQGIWWSPWGKMISDQPATGDMLCSNFAIPCFAVSLSCEGKSRLKKKERIQKHNV